MVGFRYFTHSVQTGRPCRCFQVGEDISVQKGSPFGFYLSRECSVMMGPIKTPSVAPVRKIWHLVWDFFYGDTVLPIFMDSISSPRHWNPHKDI